MRVTLTSNLRDAQAQLQQIEQQIATRSRELASGRRLNALSDDPSASAGAVVERGELSRIDSYARAADSVDARLSVTDSLLSDVILQITAAQTVTAGARGSTVTATQRNALATQLEGIRDTILADVNTQIHGVYLFAGAASTTQPYVKSGGVVSAYQGDATDVLVDVGRNTAIKMSMNGDTLIRGTDPNDLFAELELLITAVRAGDTVGIDAGFQSLNRAFSRATTAQTRLGNDLRLLGDQRLQLGSRRVDSVKRLSKHEDTNFVESITALQAAETAYQAAVRAISLRLPLSLMDFVR